MVELWVKNCYDRCEVMQVQLKQRLSKEIAHLSFRPTILSASSFLSVVNDYENLFEEWVAKEDGLYGLYSPSKFEVMEFHSHKILYMFEDHTSTNRLNEDIIKYTTGAFGKYHEQFNVKQVRRVGYGIAKILETQFKFDELCHLIYQKFYASNEALAFMSAKNQPRDWMFVVEGENNNFKNHFEIGPVEPQESLKLFNSSFIEVEKGLTLADGNLYLRIDVFTDSTANIEMTHVNDTLSEAQAETYRLLNEFKNYISN